MISTPGSFIVDPNIGKRKRKVNSKKKIILPYQGRKKSPEPNRPGAKVERRSRIKQSGAT
jgi:hypothetical protein